MNFSIQNQRPIILRINAEFANGIDYVRLRQEFRFHRSRLGAGSYHFSVYAISDYGFNCIDHNGFTRPGLPGYNVQAFFKRYAQVLNQSDVLYE
jgi:hypothetical protein